MLFTRIAYCSGLPTPYICSPLLSLFPLCFDCARSAVWPMSSVATLCLSTRVVCSSSSSIDHSRHQIGCKLWQHFLNKTTIKLNVKPHQESIPPGTNWHQWHIGLRWVTNLETRHTHVLLYLLFYVLQVNSIIATGHSTFLASAIIHHGTMRIEPITHVLYPMRRAWSSFFDLNCFVF